MFGFQKNCYKNKNAHKGLGKIFVRHVSENKLVSQIYKEFL